MIIDSRSARDTMRSQLSRYLVGPMEVQETIREAPADFYHTGILYPRHTPLDPEENDLIIPGNIRGEEGSDDTDLLDFANSKTQSAMGMTFFLPMTADTLNLTISWGEYQQPSTGDEEVKKEYLWERTPVEHGLKLNIKDKPQVQQLGRLDLYTRSYEADGLRAVTLSLLHKENKSESNRSSQACFQVRMIVSSSNGAFMPAPASPGKRQDDEYAAHELLYRNKHCYAIGHGVGVEWGSKPITEIKTTWLPHVEVSKASADILPGTQCLDMEWLGTTEDVSSVATALQQLPDEYRTWIDHQSTVLDEIIASESLKKRALLKTAGEKHIKNARQQLQRIEAGIKWLTLNPKAFLAFRLANQTIATALKWRLKSKGLDNKPRWRAFQLGFILAAMQGTAEHDHSDRNIVDLIWFPTGGGKTEAYLGLTAMVLFHRLLVAKTPEDMQGTSVLTRYTLRLLTIQQFERTASMLCAANVVKDTLENYKEWPDFTLGLFVGSAATPNTLSEADKIRKNTYQAATDCTTLPLSSCPVCQNPLLTSDQYIDKASEKLITKCHIEKCAANRGADGICVCGC